ncbi:MAG: prolipoprotein diacylglyceryl transferase [Ignavibacteriales bacterium]|nr:prolipoprotein diacylglyceryl transferase [Ignavibacteriales bacterium]
MYPELFKIGPFTVHSFGLMMAVGFIAASYLLTKELKRFGYDPNLGSNITLIAVIFGVAGSKILFLIEDWNHFIQNPLREAFSPGGLTWYGGFFLATAAIWIYTKRKKIPFLTICDAAAPALMIGYGIARIGCHLSGDGDYGFPTSLPWGAEYSGGTYPPSIAFRDFPEIVQQYGVGGLVPDNIKVHPTPVYEFIFSLLLFLILWKLRLKKFNAGILFMIYLIFYGMERFFIEFLRLNPRLLFGLSEAQLISFILIITGIFGISILKKNKSTTLKISN